jgi:hypothetical protein
MNLNPGLTSNPALAQPMSTHGCKSPRYQPQERPGMQPAGTARGRSKALDRLVPAAWQDSAPQASRAPSGMGIRVAASVCPVTMAGGMARPWNSLPRQALQQGATTLLTVTVLVMLAAISAAMGSRSLWLERLASDNRGQALQARLAAESALARAAAALQQAAQAGDLSLFWQDARPADCPPGHPAPGWECRRLDWPASDHKAGSAEAWHLQTLALRHLTHSPHVVELQARAWQGSMQTLVRQSLYQPALAPLPATVAAGMATPLAGAEAAPAGSAACEAPAWRAALGAQHETALRQLSAHQARAGLDEGSTPPRTVYWVDNPQAWTQSLGDPARPVLLVFSRLACAGVCPRLAAGTQVHGTVVFDAGCHADALPAGAAGQIDGQVNGLVLGPDGPATGARITPDPRARDALAQRWPQGMDTTQVQWVAGSWWMETGP